MITIINYGLGNINALLNVYKRMNIETKLAHSTADLLDATHLILPGVGAFDYAMNQLNASGLRPQLDELVLQHQIPILGICVGMQILAQDSEEGTQSGLGWLKGHVRHFSNQLNIKQFPLPHMGWNDVVPINSPVLFKHLENHPQFYFLHSYYFDCPDNLNIGATSQYGFNFSCVVNHKNIYGVQFHPEKSHHWGAALLKNFAEI